MRQFRLPAAKALLAVFALFFALSGCQTAGMSQSSPPEPFSVQPAQPAEESTPDGTPESKPEDGAPGMIDLFGEFTFKKPEQPVPSAPTVLFFGNSFIFYNDLPSMFLKLSWSGGIRADVYELSEGGYRLERFADPDDELGAVAYQGLTDYDWDYVILQEQSRLPTMEAETMMYPAARTLDELIRKAGGQTVFLMTWAYRDGDDLSEFGVQKKTTREEMQAELFTAYETIAKELDALLSPAGAAFIRSARENPEIELWDPEDGMHPTVAGSYLAACTLYATLYDKSPVGLDFTAELEPDVARTLQQTAAELVLGETLSESGDAA